MIFMVVRCTTSKSILQNKGVFIRGFTGFQILRRGYPIASNAVLGGRLQPGTTTLLKSRNHSAASLCVQRTSLPSCFNNGTTNQVRSLHAGAGGGSDSQGSGEKPLALPPLMQFPNVMWPKFLNTIRNWFFTHFVIKPYFDNEFSVHEFMKGAQEAVALVSTKLSAGQFDDLEGLVDPSVISELKQTISTFNVFQQNLLKVAVEDVFFSFPYQIGIILPNDLSPSETQKYIESGQKPPPQVRHVEITVVLHVLRGMAEMQQKGDTGSSFNLVDFTKDESNKYKVMVCNYRFFRDFTQGCNDPSWIINMVNHFLPSDRR